MVRKVITFSERFFNNLKEFGLDFDKTKQNILSHIDKKEKDLSLYKRMLFYTPYINEAKNTCWLDM